MNRAMRRESRKFTTEELANIMLKERHEATKECVHNYSVALSLVLRDKLGYGKKRTCRFVEAIMEIFDDVNKGLLTFEDIEETLKTEVDLVFSYNKQ